MDNRLDFITKIDQNGIDLMIEFRKSYIALDEALRYITQNMEKPLDAASNRTLSLARTHLETSLQFTIKTLCLQYEIKE